MNLKYLNLPVLLLLVIAASLCRAQSPVLWDMTYDGGADSTAIMFSYNIDSGAFTDRHNFGQAVEGNAPAGALIEASDGLLYGMTWGGGANGFGTIFSYNIATGAYTDLHDFDSVHGKWPIGSLMQASNGLLYGTTGYGGTYDTGSSLGGVLFSYNISTGYYDVLHNFGVGDDGQLPSGAPIEASNGLLYGMTGQGGPYDTGLLSYGGIIYSYNISSGGYTALYYFGAGTDGQYPTGSLLNISDSLFYGATVSGGTHEAGGPAGNNAGVLFSYNINTGAETILYDFGADSDGINPNGALIMANNGLLYGTTWGGGIFKPNFPFYLGGVLFSYNLTTGVETVVHYFGNDTDGYSPSGPLLQASNGLLYGITLQGGIDSGGIIYSYNISTQAYAGLHDFAQSIEDVDFNYSLLEVDSFSATGIRQPAGANSNIQVFPNPSSGQFTIKLPGEQAGYPVDIYNVLGEKIYHSVLSIGGQNIIDLSNEPSGIYLISLSAGQAGVQSEEWIKTGKLILAK